MQIIFNHRLLASAAVVLSLVGCATHHQRAPVEDRSRSNGNAASGSNAPARVLPGAENAGKPGYYTVKPNDTLIRVSLETGQNWRDLAAWNNLDNPNLIEVGQVLRVVPPDATASANANASGASSTKPIASPNIQARAIDPKAPASAAASGVKPGASSASGATAPASQAASSTEPPKDPVAKDPREADEPNWQWPANGPLLGGFEEGKRKGLVIGGKAGDPVFASADGRVVYAGSGLRGYGNLVIIKHNAEYLTAYAHNQTLLVKEDQAVRKGQKIAEMGSTDADRVQLHFEIRKQGKPVDPARQLPTR
ncbi:peptidoglycan DD-metalloendopeptidase family protein [Aquabacterium sp. CECT 9606]|uniref:peptidoglycan DD-metalloendopeptidase family protein n=1 Tax=Aquabacterium sp. CECT 9606 TaxID=2845822 RepID=UPI001E4FBAF4|nr:peptidoglycan DD-metalloendopeptidase family protein [Aquabacterium sp. CECT 9606]CAH0349282.1 Murein hydrolase activator NlpD [Aquabacterium sp. CECT 9606]